MCGVALCAVNGGSEIISDAVFILTAYGSLKTCREKASVNISGGKEIVKGNQQLDWMAWKGWRKDETKKLWCEDVMCEVLTSY